MSKNPGENIADRKIENRKKLKFSKFLLEKQGKRILTPIHRLLIQYQYSIIICSLNYTDQNNLEVNYCEK